MLKITFNTTERVELKVIFLSYITRYVQVDAKVSNIDFHGSHILLLRKKEAAPELIPELLPAYKIIIPIRLADSIITGA